MRKFKVYYSVTEYFYKEIEAESLEEAISFARENKCNKEEPHPNLIPIIEYLNKIELDEEATINNNL